ncbi:MAG: SRPBCC family protein [Methylococcales bacterium]|nr:SRPBCC family protein [Methylococcales bacterium]
MIEHINVTKTINAIADQAWAAISRIGGLDRWFPIISGCSVLGAGEGATRILTMVDGGKIKDRIESIDHQQQSLRYNRIESPFPVLSYLGTVNVRKVSDAKAELSWTVEIDVQEGQRDAMVGLIHHALTEGIDGLEVELQQLNRT